MKLCHVLACVAALHVPQQQALHQRSSPRLKHCKCHPQLGLFDVNFVPGCWRKLYGLNWSAELVLYECCSVCHSSRLCVCHTIRLCSKPATRATVAAGACFVCCPYLAGEINSGLSSSAEAALSECCGWAAVAACAFYSTAARGVLE